MLNPVQDAEAEDQVEALVELVEVEGVQATIGDPRAEQRRDRPETLATDELGPPAGAHPVAVLLGVDRDDASRTARLREEGVEAVEGADVEDAHAAQILP